MPQLDGADSPRPVVHIPADAAGRNYHLVCEVHDDGPFRLPAYRRVIIEVR